MSETDKGTILVTGCTSGIGLEVSKHLHKSGYGLLLVGRNEEKLNALSGELDGSACFVCDLERSDHIKEIFTYCLSEKIKLSGMVHSAGYAVNTPVRSYKEESMKRQMQIHYYAFMELCRHFYSKRISVDGAGIIALSSLASVSRKKGSALYAASKNALNAAVSVISKEFIKRFIRVNAVLPAYVDTRMNDGLEDLLDIETVQPLGLIKPENVAFLVEFLLSDQSKYITGAFIPISAGMEV